MAGWVRKAMDLKALTTQRSYLDHNATTPLHPSARAAMVASWDIAGNPSSVHAEGRAARALLDEARHAVAAFVETSPENVVFTSGGTEALNIALSAEATRAGRAYSRLLVGAGEHPAVLQGHRFGAAAEIVPLRSDGRLDLAALERQIAGEPVLLAIQAANNETGVLQPVRDAADLVHAAGGFVLCDAVQAAGKVACDVRVFAADALALSAHKFGGPKGVGALCFSAPDHHFNRGVVRGGGQEQGLRAGTENLVGIAGMGAACRSAAERRVTQASDLSRWRDDVDAAVFAAAPAAIVFGRSATRLPNTTCFAVPGIDAQILLMSLDLDGVAVSAGSACSAGRVRPSHVLSAMGVPDGLAQHALRVSLGWTTTRRDIEAFAQAFAKAMGRMRPRAAA